MINDTNAFAEESAYDDERDIDGGTAHKNSVETFPYAASASSSSWFHWGFCFSLNCSLSTYFGFRGGNRE